jgi:hypothetical protein
MSVATRIGVGGDRTQWRLSRGRARALARMGPWGVIRDAFRGSQTECQRTSVGLLAGFARDVGANLKGPGLLRIQRQIGAVQVEGCLHRESPSSPNRVGHGFSSP